MDLNLKNKIALITGSSVGIGEAVAEQFAKEGVDLILCSRNKNNIEKVANELQIKYSIKAKGLSIDLTNKKSFNILDNFIMDEFGGVDILINNAGTGTNETIMEAEDEKWQYYWDLHVMATVRTTKIVVPYMVKKGGGSIIQSASICASQPLWYEPIYNVTKAALVMLGKNMSNELIGKNIRVNTINAGLILTPDWIKTAKELTKDKEITWEDYINSIANENAPIKRFGSPDELAKFYVFLSSECASYCVGSTYYIDGGMLKVIK